MSTRSLAVMSSGLALCVAAMWLVEAGAGSGGGPGLADADVELAVPLPARGGVDANDRGGKSGDKAVESGDEAEARVLHGSSLAGVWLQVGDPDWLGLLVWFEPKERIFAVDDAGRLPLTAAKGTFELVGDKIVFDSEESSLCNEGDRWEWQADRTRDALHIVHTRSSPPPCRIRAGNVWTFIRVSPASAASARAHRRYAAERPSIPEDVHPSDRRSHLM